jgi:hypothetical protein
MPLAGGSVTTLLSGDAVPGQMVIAGGTIYGLSGAVTSMPLGGSSVVTLASTFYADNSSEPLVVDDVNVYWPEFEAGKVLMVPRSGGRVTTLASGRNGPRSVAVDSSYVYWTDRDHDILKVAIP